MQEINPRLSKQLGNWCVDTREEAYSSKLPLKAMRGMAGHPLQIGSYVVHRSTVVPAISLQKQIFPFIENAELQVLGKPHLATAIPFLGMLKDLRSIIIQDVADLLNQGRHHVIFNDLVFDCEQFTNFRFEVAIVVQNSISRSVLLGQRGENIETESADALILKVDEVHAEVHAEHQKLYVIPTIDYLLGVIRHLVTYKVVDCVNTTPNADDSDGIAKANELKTISWKYAIQKQQPFTDIRNKQ